MIVSDSVTDLRLTNSYPQFNFTNTFQSPPITFLNLTVKAILTLNGKFKSWKVTAMRKVVYIPYRDITDSVLSERYIFNIGQLVTGQVPRTINPKLPTLIDNKAYSGETMSLSEILKLYEKASFLENFKIVVPDYVEDYIKTSQMYGEAIREILRNRYDFSRFIFVIQGRTVSEYVICLKYLINIFKKFKHCGVSIREVTVGIGGIKVKPVSQRPIIAREVASRVRELLDRKWAKRIRIHLFGGDLRTIENCWNLIDSVDLTTFHHCVNSQYGFRLIITKDTGKVIEPRVFIKDLESDGKVDYEAVRVHNLREYLRAINLRVKSLRTNK